MSSVPREELDAILERHRDALAAERDGRRSSIYDETYEWLNAAEDFADEVDRLQKLLDARPLPDDDAPLVTKTGKVLTDADIEALADEAEAGYDVEHLKGKPNRPSLATRALRAMLPPDAPEVADSLEKTAAEFEVLYAAYGSVPFISDLRRAAAILRGEP